jgi:serine/threonine protein kinase
MARLSLLSASVVAQPDITAINATAATLFRLATQGVTQRMQGSIFVRGIVEQLAKGLQALHGKEMLHQDIRPENLMIDRSGTAKIIDLATTHVAGLADNAHESRAPAIEGTLQYTAPEYFVGHGGSARSDLFSLAVITYRMLTAQLPYGLHVSRIRTRADASRLRYVPRPAR